jgi:hypothetical protein
MDRFGGGSGGGGNDCFLASICFEDGIVTSLIEKHVEYRMDK